MCFSAVLFIIVMIRICIMHAISIYKCMHVCVCMYVSIHASMYECNIYIPSIIRMYIISCIIRLSCQFFTSCIFIAINSPFNLYFAIHWIDSSICDQLCDIFKKIKECIEK